jgi:regulator of protease activity HflC (stomatin/prohibitin superfamily)
MLVYGIVVDQVNITNFDFSQSFNAAIEAKVTAEQSALAAKNKLEQVKFEAEQRVTQAKGEAEAIKIQAAAIQAQGGQEYVSLKWVEKWNGALPTTQLGNSGFTPLISISK